MKISSKITNVNKGSFKNETIIREEILESDKYLKWVINSMMLLGGLGFFIAGLSSYLKQNLIYFINVDQITFFPQGLTMSFYGTCGILVSLNQIRILFFKIGEGFNEFNKEKGIMKIYRKGFLGKESDINITHPLKDIVRKF